jgi:hypothetical protein
MENGKLPLQPWVSIRDCCRLFGLRYTSAKIAINQDRFPVPTYKLGRMHVVDRDVMDRYFAERREQGLKQLNSAPPVKIDRRKNNKGRPRKRVAPVAAASV